MSLILLSGLGVLVWYVVAAPGSQALGPVLARGNPDLAEVALSFDDGPGPQTPQILAILRDAGVRATFFVCGASVERYPELARQIAVEGHEIGNHTYSHPRLLGRSPGKIFREIDRAQKLILHHTGVSPRLFRPPYGLRWFGLSAILRQQGMTAVMWSANGRDWKSIAEQITHRVLRQGRPGAIVLLHDASPPGKAANRQETVKALPDIVRQMGQRYRFVTVSEMHSRR